jgi:cytidylate kinase
MTLRIAEIGPPLHGFRGDESVGPFARTDGRARPKGLTVTISRESGSRGATIARKVGEFLGWQVFDQEMLDYLVQDDAGRAQLLADVPDTVREWAEAHLSNLRNGGHLVGDDPQTVEMFRLILSVAARGEAVIVGRGAGFVLPPESTVHVRIVSPFEARVSYLAQWLRLSREEAAAEVRARDEQRARFLKDALRRDANDPTAYDAVVNATRLGVEATAQFIGWAVRTKQQFAELAEQSEA